MTLAAPTSPTVSATSALQPSFVDSPLAPPYQQQQRLKIQLTGFGLNQSFEGTIMIKNWSLWEDLSSNGGSHHHSRRVGDDGQQLPLQQQLLQGGYDGDHSRHDSPYAYREDRRQAKNVKRAADVTGATYYVVAVVLVYGMSIVLLIASHIKRKHSKVLEDVQINKYLQEFQVFREKSSRDNYRSLKRDITAKLKQQKERSHHHHNHHGHTTSNGLGAHKSSCASLLLLAGGAGGSGGNGGNGAATHNSSGGSGAQLLLPTIKENGANFSADGSSPDSKSSINNSVSNGHLFALASRKKHSFAFLHSANFKRTITSTSLFTNQLSETHQQPQPMAASESVASSTASISTAVPLAGLNELPFSPPRCWAASSSLPTATASPTTISLRRNQSISLLDRSQRVVAPAPVGFQSEHPLAVTAPSSLLSTKSSYHKLGAGVSVDSCYPSLCIVNENGVKICAESFDDSCSHLPMETSQSIHVGLNVAETEPFSAASSKETTGDSGIEPEVGGAQLLVVKNAIGYRRVSCPYVQLVTGN